jgi:uncharacterized protein YjbJ (UPF0337 family)
MSFLPGRLINRRFTMRLPPPSMLGLTAPLPRACCITTPAHACEPARRSTWPAFCVVEVSRAKLARVIQGGRMNKDQVKGIGLRVKGKLNEAVGKATGNRSQEIKGDLQQAAGGIRQSFGKAKARVRKTLS